MSGSPNIDGLGRLVFEDIRAIEPTAAEIQAARRLAAAAGHRSPTRRTLAVAAASAALMAGTAVAVPHTREALTDAYGALKDFFNGGAPPGEPVPSGEAPGLLNWFTGVDPANATVIAQAGATRVIAFRQGETGMACFGYGLTAEECRPDADWIAQLADEPVLLRGPLPEPSGGKLPLVGFIADAVARIELRYADGGVERLDGPRYGFVLLADPNRRPTTLIATDATGAVLSTIDLTTLQWRFVP